MTALRLDMFVTPMERYDGNDGGKVPDGCDGKTGLPP